MIYEERFHGKIKIPRYLSFLKNSNLCKTIFIKKQLNLEYKHMNRPPGVSFESRILATVAEHACMDIKSMSVQDSSLFMEGEILRWPVYRGGSLFMYGARCIWGFREEGKF